jgi:hypothetical protein
MTTALVNVCDYCGQAPAHYCFYEGRHLCVACDIWNEIGEQNDKDKRNDGRTGDGADGLSTADDDAKQRQPGVRV